MVQAMFGFMHFMTKRLVRPDDKFAWGVVVDFEFTAIARGVLEKEAPKSTS